MTFAQNDKLTLQKPLRVWPGVVIVILALLLRYVVPIVAPGALFYGVIGQVIGALAILVWWLFFSRAPWVERLGAVVLMTAQLSGRAMPRPTPRRKFRAGASRAHL
jgi:outer membrane protein assembly factor BamB